RVVWWAGARVEYAVSDRAHLHDDRHWSDLDHVAHDLPDPAGYQRPGPAEEHRALRVRHRVLEDGGTEAQGPGLERDPFVSVHEVGDGRRLLEVQVFDRDRGQLRLRGLVHRHARPNAGTCQKDSVPQAFFFPSTASAMARAFSFGREQT